VYLTIRLRGEEAAQLLKAINAGALREFGVIGGEIEHLALRVPTDPPPPAVVSTAHSTVPEVPTEASRTKPHTHIPFPRGGDEGSVTRLVAAMRSGGDASAQQLWDRYFDRLVHLARSKLQTRPRRGAVDDEEDAALSAFDSFWRGAAAGRFPPLSDRDDLWRLLVVLTSRKIRDQIERQQTLKRSGAPKATGDDDLEQFVSAEPAPEYAAMVLEQYRRLRIGLGDDSLRQILDLRLEGYTVTEIATRMNRSRRAIERKLALIRSIWLKESKE
jgi:RNA polymerase sigma factor (sigma-70 family)